MSGTDDLRAIPPLAAALRWPEPGLRNAAAVTLIRLLPQVQAADAVLLDAPTRSCLHQQLTPQKVSRQEELASAILKALQQAGDSSDLRPIAALAGSHARTETEQRMQRAAQTSLQELNNASGRTDEPTRTK